MIVPAAIVIDEVVIGTTGDAYLGGGAVEAPRRTVQTSFCCICHLIVLAIPAAVVVDEVVVCPTGEAYLGRGAVEAP